MRVWVVLRWGAEVCCVLAFTIDTIHLHRHAILLNANLFTIFFLAVFWHFDSPKHSEGFRQAFVIGGLLALYKLVLLHLTDDLCLQIMESFKVSLELSELLLFNQDMLLEGSILTIFNFYRQLRTLISLDPNWLAWTGQAYETLRKREGCSSHIVFNLSRRRNTRPIG